MRILYYYKDYSTMMYQWQHVHIFDELEHHECYVEVFNPLKYYTYDEANERLIAEIKSNPPELFMTPHTSKELYPDTIKTIRQLGIPTLLICFDNLLVPFIHFDIAPMFDLVWLTSKETKALFDKRGCHTVFLPYAANPYMKGENESIKGVCFVGNPYGSRTNMINFLTANGIDIYCHCKEALTTQQGSSHCKEEKDSGMHTSKIIFEFLKFKQGRHVILGALVNRLFKRSKIYENKHLHYEYVVKCENVYQTYSKYSLALASTSARNTGVLRHPLQIVNLRSFEIPMSCAVQLCQYSPEIAEYFEEGKEIVLYRDNDEMIDKVHYYLNNEKLRMTIRNLARRRAEAEHTWWNRFSFIFKQFNLLPKGYL